MLELRNLADDDLEDLLREVLRILGRDALATEPGVDQGSIEVNQPLPRDGIQAIVQPLEQRGGRLGHGASSPPIDGSQEEGNPGAVKVTPNGPADTCRRSPASYPSRRGPIRMSPIPLVFQGSSFSYIL